VTKNQVACYPWGGGGSNSLIDITAVSQHETGEISKSLTPPGLTMNIP
jgi:glutamate dehydrogenase/leucine dehydrogenase